MIDDEFHWWQPRYIKWCPVCRLRERNGKDEFCARCTADLIETLEEMLNG